MQKKCETTKFEMKTIYINNFEIEMLKNENINNKYYLIIS
jgi:hypothetical protein